MKRPDGFTLVEVLVAMAVLSVGLLGLASLQIVALRANSSALYRTQANNLTYLIIDSMRVNRQAALTSSGGGLCY
ncbi:type IV pilus assembly protein PilV [Gammaproteobacteria bacterium]